VSCLRKAVLPPPGVFTKNDLYAQQRWRDVQALTNIFWKRWIAEIIPSLQVRRKWMEIADNVKVGDIVLLADEQQKRNHWPLARVMAVYPGDNGLVRKVLIRAQKKEYERPIHKLVKLFSPLENTDEDDDLEEPSNVGSVKAWEPRNLIKNILTQSLYLKVSLAPFRKGREGLVMITEEHAVLLGLASWPPGGASGCNAKVGQEDGKFSTEGRSFLVALFTRD